MTHIVDIRHRLISTYNGWQILRTVLAFTTMGLAAWWFPGDFSFVRDYRWFLVAVGLLYLAGLSILTVTIRQKLDQVSDETSISALIRFETRWHSILLTVAALLVPLASPYYVNIAWFASAFLFCFVLANPLMTESISRLVVVSPVAGWAIHQAIHFLIEGQGLHFPALAFCIVVSFALYYSRRYFVRQLVQAELETGPSQTEAHFASHHGLTPREEEVLGRVLRGRVTKEISTDLGISETTVKTHVKNLLAKTRTRTRLELMVEFNRSRGSVSP